MALDIAWTLNPSTGKFTFLFDDGGDLVLDDKAVYSVMATLLSRRGEYYWSGSHGTVLATIRNERRDLTGSRLTACGVDAVSQVQAASLISDGSAAATKLSSGRWGLTLRWQTATGTVSRRVEF